MSPLVIVAVALVIVRQLRARAISVGLMVALPAVLLGLGAQRIDHAPPADAASAAVLGIGIVVAVGLGLLRGRSERVWRDADGTALHQATIVTLGLWAATILVRVASIAAERALGTGVDLTAEIELVCGASLAAQFAVVAWRAGLLDDLRAQVA